MEEYVYVLISKYNIKDEDDGINVEIVGVFRNFETAIEEMEEYINQRKEANWVVDNSYKKGDNGATLFYKKQNNWEEYLDLLIFEKEIK